MSKTKLMLGNNLDSLKKLPDNSIDSVVTDPPYALNFMNKKWDAEVPSVDFWKEVWRVLKPGGHVLSFGGTRTYHRMVVNIEDVGFEIRDQIMWLYGSGFPKSHNIGKAVDKLQGNDRVETGNGYIRGDLSTFEIGANGIKSGEYKETKGNSKWEGWGTALKPANEPICVARKPLSEKSVAENVLKWKTGGINVDGSRVGSDGGGTNCNNRDENGECLGHSDGGLSLMTSTKHSNNKEEGRFPANLILECICDEVIKSESHTNPNCPCYLLDEQSGLIKSSKFKPEYNGGFGAESNSYINHKPGGSIVNTERGYNDKGGASRFFYQAKVSKAERNMGLDGFEDKVIEGRDPGQDERNVAYKKRPTPTKNVHPTVKPINLMTYLCRLITPQGGIVLDPFMGSGSTGIAAQLEGFKFVGMEMDEDYFKIASTRIENFEKYRKFLK